MQDESRSPRRVAPTGRLDTLTREAQRTLRARMTAARTSVSRKARGYSDLERVRRELGRFHHRGSVT
jgi:hypothetical protein